MEIALSILIPVCATVLIVVKWIVRPKPDTTQLRLLEMQVLKWAADHYNSDRMLKGRGIVAYFEKWYPDGPEERK